MVDEPELHMFFFFSLFQWFIAPRTNWSLKLSADSLWSAHLLLKQLLCYISIEVRSGWEILSWIWTLTWHLLNNPFKYLFESGTHSVVALALLSSFTFAFCLFRLLWICNGTAKEHQWLVLVSAVFLLWNCFTFPKLLRSLLILSD